MSVGVTTDKKQTNNTVKLRIENDFWRWSLEKTIWWLLLRKTV